jgi:Flp pilus assembly protein TadG
MRVEDLARFIRRARSTRDGNVALMFALMFIPLVAAAGIAIDMYRANEARLALSQAADAAVLAAARAKLMNPSLTDAAAETIAKKMFNAHATKIGDLTVSDFDFVYDAGAETYRVNSKADLETTLLKMTGRKTMALDILSEAKAGAPRALEVVLVLDNTGSMNGQKMTDLKAAAGDLIDEIMAGADNETKVGVVPFARHVNLGMSRAGEAWLQIDANGVWNENVCTVDAAAATASGCSEVASTCYWDGAPYSCMLWQCPSGDPPQTCSITSHVTSWYGCVGSRDHPLNIEDRDYASDPVPGVNNAGGPDCPTEVTPMTTSKSTVQNAINAMTVGGDTYIAGGLFWGQALISHEEPFAEGKSYEDLQAEGGVKAIVLMTDGENTASPDDGEAHYDDDTAEANGYTEEMCDEIKSENVRLYTIAFDVTDASVTTLMRDCATDPDYFYDAGDADALADAFDAVGKSLVDLALTK